MKGLVKILCFSLIMLLLGFFLNSGSKVLTSGEEPSPPVYGKNGDWYWWTDNVDFKLKPGGMATVYWYMRDSVARPPNWSIKVWFHLQPDPPRWLQVAYVVNTFHESHGQWPENITNIWATFLVDKEASRGLNHTFTDVTGTYTYYDEGGNTKEGWSGNLDGFRVSVTVVSGVPEFPLGFAMEITLISLIAYVWWRSKQRKK